MLVFRYMSPTFAAVIPLSLKMVAVVLVPVIFVPVYHCAEVPADPVAPLNAIWKVNSLWMVMFPLSSWTGMSTTPPVVTVFATDMVRVG